ncbi:MsnO8 family LLM class oxidoreductase [Pyxidicoccus sp. 3LG]
MEDFTSDVQELIDLLAGNTPADQPFGVMPAVPRAEGMPEVWLLGSSGFSAQLAGVLGLPFSFAHHFSPQNTLPAVKLYRERFAREGHKHASKVLLAVGVVAADTRERAAEVASSLALSWVRIHTGKTGPIPSPEEARRHPWTDAERAIADNFLSTQVIGDVATVREGLIRLANATGADELMLSTMAHSVEDRMRSYELVAESFGLTATPAASAG